MVVHVKYTRTFAESSDEARSAQTLVLCDQVEAGGAVSTGQVGIAHLLALVDVHLAGASFVTRCARARECINQVGA